MDSIINIEVTMTTLQITVLDPSVVPLFSDLITAGRIAVSEHQNNETDKERRSRRLESLDQHLAEYQATQGNPEPLSATQITAEIKQMRAERKTTSRKH
ncbi:hypothetical protein FACS189443_2060 [Planctomycetales bacterium]|nr:hypothetical protein FACS189443_2060 [Planctomycetales bacterium]